MEKQKNIPQMRFPEFEKGWDAKTLGNIAMFSKGKGLSKSDISENGVTECIRYGELYTTYNETINTVISKTNINPDDLVLSETNDIIIPASGETHIDIAKASCVLKSGVALGGDLNIIRTPNNGVFLSYYLNSSKKQDIAQLAQGISVVHLYAGQLSKLQLNLPTLSEQQKIASFITAIDQKISQIKHKKNLLEQYKKGVMQKIFSQQIRFKDDNREDYPKWENKKLSEYLYVSKNKNFTGKYGKVDVLSVSGDYGIVNQIEFQGRSFAGESVLNYGEVETGDIVYTKSPLKNNPYGIIKVNKGKAGIVSTLYAVYKCKDNAIGEYFDYYFQLDEKLNGYLRPLVHKGAKNDMKINNERVLIDTLSVPCKKEQEKIVTFLKAIDNKINHIQKQIEKAEAWKKGLMKQMFV